MTAAVTAENLAMIYIMTMTGILSPLFLTKVMKTNGQPATLTLQPLGF